MTYPPEDNDMPTGCLVGAVIIILFLFFAPILLDWIGNHVEIIFK